MTEEVKCQCAECSRYGEPIQWVYIDTDFNFNRSDAKDHLGYDA